MKLNAKDLPANGTPKQVECNGILFEVRRVKRLSDGRRWCYNARRLPALNDFSGWWTRWNWALMKADIRLMSKEVENDPS